MQKCGFLLKKNEKVLSKQVLWESRAIGSLCVKQEYRLQQRRALVEVCALWMVIGWTEPC